MHPVEILEKISQEAKNKTNKKIIAVYRESFNSNDDIELYKLRALLIYFQMEYFRGARMQRTTLQKIEIDNSIRFSLKPSINENA